MTDDELTNALNDRNASVVHFSHHANMREGCVFPNDLQNAIANCSQWTLSCCVVWPDHRMNLPGSVGVIFAPLVQHVISISNDDSGSTTLPNGEELSGGVKLTKQNFESSFNVMPDRYNEWRVQGADVVGIYIENPNAILVKKIQTFVTPLDEVETITGTSVDLTFVKQSFDGYKFYTMSSSGLVEI